LSLANWAFAVRRRNPPSALLEKPPDMFSAAGRPQLSTMYYVFLPHFKRSPVLKHVPAMMSIGPTPRFAHYADDARLRPHLEFVA